jgi:hypothetical protein
MSWLGFSMGLGTVVDGIGLALTSIKNAADLAKILLEIRDITKIREVSADLLGQIASAQSLTLATQRDQSALIAEIDDLKKKIVQFENWEREKARYELESLPPGVLVYRIKEAERGAEPAHKICANCYNKGIKSFLHNLGKHNGQDHWRCHSCGFNERVGPFTRPAVNLHHS